MAFNCQQKTKTKFVLYQVRNTRRSVRRGESCLTMYNSNSLFSDFIKWNIQN